MKIGTSNTIFALLILLIATGSMAQPRPLRRLTVSHTSPTSSTGSVEVSGVFSSTYAGWNAFSDNRQFWISQVNESPAWITYQFSGAERVVRGYRFDFANGSLTSRAPKKFHFQVQRGSSWETIDTRCCETGWSGSEERLYHLAQEVTGQKFRFLFEEDNDSRRAIVVISLRQIQIL